MKMNKKPVIKMSAIPMPEKKLSVSDESMDEGSDDEEASELPEMEDMESDDAMAEFSDDDLLAEVKKRGLSLTEGENAVSSDGMDDAAGMAY